MKEFICELEKEAKFSPGGYVKSIAEKINKKFPSKGKLDSYVRNPIRFVANVGKLPFTALERYPIALPAVAGAAYGGHKYYKYKKDQVANVDPMEYLTANDYAQ